MEYFLGIDQGGSKTAAVICGAGGAILGAGTDAGLSGVYFRDSDEKYLRRIAGAAESACAAAGIGLGMITAACGGMNGADWDFEYPALRDALSRALNLADVTVLNDCVAAMRGGSASRECAVVCAGSGLNAAVRGSSGRQIVYGYYVDRSHQGGSALGAAAFRKAVEAGIGLCEETSLTGLILEYTGYGSAEELMIDVTMGRLSPEYKEFAPLLARAFADGDAEACRAVEEFSRGVAKYVTAGMKRLGLSGQSEMSVPSVPSVSPGRARAAPGGALNSAPSGGALTGVSTPDAINSGGVCKDGPLLDVVFSGGVFKGAGALIADRIFEIIADSEPGVRKVHARYEPVCGAALTLLDAFYGGAIPARAAAAFDESAAAKGLLRPVYAV